MDFKQKYNNWINYQFDIVKKYNKLLPFDKQIKVLFRGESQKFEQPFKPSVFRKSKMLLDINNIYSEATARFYNDFENEKTRFDKLVKMQHYKIPTKLVDVTEDPDIALYFACSENFNRKGKIFAFFISSEGIIFPDNPLVDLITTSILSAGKQSIFESDNALELNRTVVKKNYWEISDVNNYYNDNSNLTHKIFIENAQKKFDLKKVYYAHELVGVFNCVPNYINQRIIRQSSSFIVGGLSLEDSILKDLLHYDKVSIFLNNLNSHYINPVLDSVPKINIYEQKCCEYLTKFLENFRDKDILDPNGFKYSFPIELVKEFHSKRINDSLEYLSILLFLYGLYGNNSKFCFYNDFLIPAKEKEMLLNNLEYKNKISESYIYPDLEHFANEINKKYKNSSSK